MKCVRRTANGLSHARNIAANLLSIGSKEKKADAAHPDSRDRTRERQCHAGLYFVGARIRTVPTTGSGLSSERAGRKFQE
jgi:hypothetical protein